MKSRLKPEELKMYNQLNKNFKRLDNGCIEFTGHTDIKGYGKINVSGKTERTHRVSYHLFNKSILGSPDRQVLHKCDNPSCINPHHLYEGTNSDNVKDRVKRNRGAVGERIHLSKYSEEFVLELKEYYKISGRSMRQCGRDYNIPESSAVHILCGRNWKHI